MKLVPFAALAFLVAAGVGPAAALDDKSLAPAWTSAGQAEKDAWIAAFRFTKAAAKRADVAACLEKYASKPLFATNALTGVTEMCESIAALSE
jgi:hypothetical protein